MAKKSQPKTAPATQAGEGGMFERDQATTSPTTAAAVPVSAPPGPPACVPKGAVKCNACSTEAVTVWCTPVAPGWMQCPQCKVKQRNLASLKAAMKCRGGKSRAAR
jgi:hypothetical protein